MATLRLTPSDREALTEGARSLGIELRSGAVDRLAEFAMLLDRWSTRTNLISCRTGRELVDRHILDSLAVAPHVDRARVVADLGSGAGFPGVPLAIVGAGCRVVLVEARRRRANFLRAVRRALRLERLMVLEQRAEAGPPADVVGVRTVVCRAVWPDAEVLGVAAGWLGAGGRLLWMRTGELESELDDDEFRKVGVAAYRVGGAAERTIHVFERR